MVEVSPNARLRLEYLILVIIGIALILGGANLTPYHSVSWVGIAVAVSGFGLIGLGIWVGSKIGRPPRPAATRPEKAGK
jgi:uncharacterized protein (DUF58 family)